MKTTLFISVFLSVCMLAQAQENHFRPGKIPLTVSVFSESVSVPNFRNFFRDPNPGIRIGTEFYYAGSKGHQLVQTPNLGFYNHKHLHNAFFTNSEFGYRKFINNAFVDITAGVGYLIIDSALPRYEKSGEGYQKISSTLGRIMPTIGLGAGYQFKTLSVFSRYELFGEMPFGYKGVPSLPHKTLHIGTRINLL